MNSIAFAALLKGADLERAWHWLRWGIAAGWTATVHGFLGQGQELAAAQLYLQLVVLDFVTGIAASWARHKRISSRVAHTGVINKLIRGLGALSLAHLADTHMGLGGTAVRDFGMLLVGVETISILENLSLLGLKIPEHLRGRFGGPQ